VTAGTVIETPEVPTVTKHVSLKVNSICRWHYFTSSLW